MLRRGFPTVILDGHVCIAPYARLARVLLSILGSPGHVVEEDRLALPFGEATFVSQVLCIGNAENIDGDETLLQPAQALFGLLTGRRSTRRSKRSSSDCIPRLSAGSSCVMLAAPASPSLLLLPPPPPPLSCSFVIPGDESSVYTLLEPCFGVASPR